MKTRRTIGAIALILGIFLAACTADGTKGEIALRCAGVVLSATGAAVGRFDKMDDDDNGYSKQDDHNPYPEE